MECPALIGSGEAVIGHADFVLEAGIGVSVGNELLPFEGYGQRKQRFLNDAEQTLGNGLRIGQHAHGCFFDEHLVIDRIADRYQRALREYLNHLQEIAIQTGVDYHRVSIEKPYKDALTEFLIRRATARGVR